MIVLMFQLLGCQPGGPESTGWVSTEATDGPTVLYDLVALPLPEIHFPMIRPLGRSDFTNRTSPQYQYPCPYCL